MIIPTYIINLKSRADRLENVQKEFEGRREFNVTIVEAIKHEVGAIGLWETIKHILLDLAHEEDEYILICEDDHEFTEHYTNEILFENIAKARKNEADILCGGVSWVSNILETGHGMFWVEKFSGLQFTIIFKKFFKRILEVEFRTQDAADYKICELSTDKFFIFPFISIQRDYGYSDATSKNNMEGRVGELFEKSNETINVIQKVAHYFGNDKKEGAVFRLESYENAVIPTYIISLPERTERRSHIEKQFEGRNEFDITIVEACRQEIGAMRLWLSIRKVVQLAMQNDDDIIIICEDDHEFTHDYSKEYLFRNIVEAHEQDINMLLGGVIDMRTALPVADNRFWVSSFWSTQFIVLYKKVFELILGESFDETITADGKLSEMVVNKAVLFPFVSVQREFGHSDRFLTCDAFRMNKTNDEKFQKCIERFQFIKDAYLKYL